jgi:Leucine-rich repeat (LRR) protein
MRRLLAGAVLVGTFGFFAPAPGGDEKPDPKRPKGIDGATAKEWAQRGFRAGWLRPSDWAGWSGADPPKEQGEFLPVLDYDSKAPLTNERLKELPPVAVPFALILREGAEVTDAGLKHLAGFGALTALHLSSTGVTNNGLKELAPLKNLTALGLDCPRITDAGLAHVAALKGLRGLHLVGARVTDAGLEHLAGLENLTVLDLRRTEVKCENLKPLTGLKKLNDLSVDPEQVTDKLLGALAEMDRLHALHQALSQDRQRPTRADEVRYVLLQGTRATGAGVRHLVGLKNVTTLVLDDRQATPEGLRHAAGLSKLSVLYLNSAEVTGEGLKPLAGLKNLTRLEVPITDGTLRALYQAGLLHLLERAGGADGKRPTGADEIVSLDLSRTRLRGGGLEYVGRLKNLTTLDLRKTPVEAVWIEDIQRTLPKCKVLTK